MDRRPKQLAREKPTPSVREVLELLGGGILLSSLFLFPHAAVGFKLIFDIYKKLKHEKDLRAWEKFNPARLRYILHRLHRQKLVSVVDQAESAYVQITEKG